MYGHIWTHSKSYRHEHLTACSMLDASGQFMEITECNEKQSTYLSSFIKYLFVF